MSIILSLTQAVFFIAFYRLWIFCHLLKTPSSLQSFSSFSKFFNPRCLKITEKVSFNIASEASYVYILTVQKLNENAKNCPFWRVFENLELAVKQCYQKGQKLVKKVKWVILGYFQNICIVGQVYIFLKSPDESFRMARKRNKTKKYCAENAIMYVLLSSRG